MTIRRTLTRGLAAAAIATPAAVVGVAVGAPTPANAAPTCGSPTWTRLATTHAVVHSCDAGAQVTYTVQCATSGPIPFPTRTVSLTRYYETAQTGLTSFRCAADGSPATAEDLTTVLSIDWSYS